jgi:flagellar biosynthesis protein FlhG
MIAVVSGKGGVGKSIVALNLAALLAARGNCTLLLDADQNLGNVDLMVGAAPRFRLGSVLAGEKDLSDVIVPLTQRLFLLPSDSGNTDYRPMSIEQQRDLLHSLSDLEQRFEYVVIDTAAGIGTIEIGFAVRSHEALVVTTPEPTSVMDAYAMIKLITAADPMVPVKLLVNEARTAAEADETARKLQMAVRHFLRRHVHFLGYVPHDLHVEKAVVLHSPVVQEFPLCAASRALAALAEKLLDQRRQRQERRFATA